MIKDIFEEEYSYPQIEKIFSESININDESKIYLIVGQLGLVKVSLCYSSMKDLKIK